MMSTSLPITDPLYPRIESSAPTISKPPYSRFDCKSFLRKQSASNPPRRTAFAATPPPTPTEVLHNPNFLISHAFFQTPIDGYLRNLPSILEQSSVTEKTSPSVLQVRSPAAPPPRATTTTSATTQHASKWAS
ncbi:hypothetical protein NX059_012546 [Plenodomus lindquistii]|nr:hypothetical protein NX059_012546 [Plenodomus lindquistii]